MKKLTFFSLLALTTAATPAMAITASSGLYLGGGAGYGTPELSKYIDSASAGAPSSAKIGGLAWSGFAGYNFALNDNWLVGLEVGYDTAGKAKYTYSDGTSEVNPSDVDALLTATYLFNNGFNFFAKGGIAHAYQKSEVTGSEVAYDTLTRNRAIAKVGFGYLFDLGNAGSLNLYAQYAHLFGHYGQADSTNLATDLISTDVAQVGLAYNFSLGGQDDGDD